MEDISLTINLVCLFCGAPLQGLEDAAYNSGDLIVCGECGESNDYDSLIEVAKEKGVDEVKKELELQLKKEFGNLFKK